MIWRRIKRIWYFIFKPKPLKFGPTICMDEQIRRLEPDPMSLFMEVFAKKKDGERAKHEFI